MKNLLKFILFILLTICIFFIKNYLLLLLLFFINLLIIVKNKISVYEYFKNLKLLLPFLVFTLFFNTFFMSFEEAFMIFFRIILCYFITYTYYKTTSDLEIAHTIEMFFYPLKLFKINTKNISLIISIALCMIPILKQEINAVKNTIKSKGAKLRINNFTLILKPVLISIIKRTGEMEKVLISKGY